jgi:transcriptional regulator with XRE-family HTH domain
VRRAGTLEVEAETSGRRDLRVERHRLAAELKRLREAARLSTYQLAERLEWSQSKVSKIERGQTAPSAEDVDAWMKAVAASAEQTARMVERVQAALTEAIPWRSAVQEGLAAKQREVAALEATATAICYYQPVTIPGPLQTPDYARLVFIAGNPGADPAEISAVVAARMERQAILHQEGKRLAFVVGEAALRWRYGPASMQRMQLDRLRVVAGLPNVFLGVLPLAGPLPVWHGHGFTLYQDRADGGDAFVHVETYSAAVNVSDPLDVEEFQQAFQRLRAASISGEDFQLLLESLMESLKGEPERGDLD